MTVSERGVIPQIMCGGIHITAAGQVEAAFARMAAGFIDILRVSADRQIYVKEFQGFLNTSHPQPLDYLPHGGYVLERIPECLIDEYSIDKIEELPRGNIVAKLPSLTTRRLVMVLLRELVTE